MQAQTKHPPSSNKGCNKGCCYAVLQLAGYVRLQKMGKNFVTWVLDLSSDITGRERLVQMYLVTFVLSQDRQASRPSCPNETCQQIAN